MIDEAKALVERLRDCAEDYWGELACKAADLIETQAREIERLQERSDALALQADEWEGKYTIVCELNERLREALRECAIVFKEYEELHLAKKTQDGDEKAYRNRVMAEKCHAALGDSK